MMGVKTPALATALAALAGFFLVLQPVRPVIRR